MADKPQRKLQTNPPIAMLKGSTNENLRSESAGVRLITPDNQSLLQGFARHTFTTENSPKHSIQTSTNGIPSLLTISSTSAFTDPRTKKRRRDDRKKESIDSLTNKTEIDTGFTFNGSFPPPNKDENAKKPRRLQPLSNAKVSSHHLESGTVKHFAFQSIGINLISTRRSQHNSIFSSELNGFFLDIPTKPREHYFDEISPGKEICDVRQPLTFSDSNQIQSILTFTPTTQKPLLSPPRLRERRLKYLKPRSDMNRT